MWQGFVNSGAALYLMDRPAEALRMYAEVLTRFDNDRDLTVSSRMMYASLLKVLGARAFAANRFAVPPICKCASSHDALLFIREALAEEIFLDAMEIAPDDLLSTLSYDLSTIQVFALLTPLLHAVNVFSAFPEEVR